MTTTKHKHNCSMMNIGLKIVRKSYYQLLSRCLINRNAYLIISCDHLSTKNNSNESETNKTSISISQNKQEISTHVKVTERVKQTTKDVTNISVIMLGVGLFSCVIYAVFKEFFSSKSPSSVFASALKKCKQDPRITELLGEPIKGHGEMTSRGRARHVSFVEYENNGKTYLRVKFYLKGSRNTATVQCETTKDSPRAHFRYLFVQTDSYPPQVIIIEDNRLLDDAPSQSQASEESSIFKIQ